MKLIAFGVLVAIVLPCISAAQVSTETPSKKDFFRKAAEEKIKAEAGEARKIFEKAVVHDEAKREEALN